jgi:formate hydrogenlyase subunit 6/NADH:ubiquinone oxidoreductase subunit I
MSTRGLTQKRMNEREIVLERAMITRHYVMRWDLERCVGCQIGPAVCPKGAISHVPGVVEGGRLTKKPSVDVDPAKCVLCGICEVTCPKNAILLQINGQHENPVQRQQAFPDFIQSTEFDRSKFDWSRRQFVIDNCPTKVISYDADQDTLVVDQEHCIRCRQCEVASGGAFQVVQSWEGRVELRRDRCVTGCRACADICPTRALHVDNSDKLALADYYCIKCGACMQVCPIQAEYVEETLSFESQGLHKKVVRKKLANADSLAIVVERWRVRHGPVESAAWTEALIQMADDKAGAQEIDRKRALKRRDLLKALAGAEAFLKRG